jgi:hypothetical protein
MSYWHVDAKGNDVKSLSRFVNRDDTRGELQAAAVVYWGAELCPWSQKVPGVSWYNLVTDWLDSFNDAPLSEFCDINVFVSLKALLQLKGFQMLLT